MANGKEIRTKVKSIKNTQKITSAMEMVAASKMRKTQQRMLRLRPYATNLLRAVEHLANSHSEYKHPFLIQRDEIKRVGFIVISSDRGLCGGLNTNLFRKLVKQMKELSEQGKEICMGVYGKKALSYFQYLGTPITAQVTQLGEAPKVEDVLGVMSAMIKAYDDGEIDALYIANNHFVNTMTQEPTVQQLLPLPKMDNVEEVSEATTWDYLYEPDSKEVLDLVLKRYTEYLVFQAILENNASEQASRMVAMKSATDNAGKMIDDLNLAYNKARQAAITQEISEIVGGAAAVS